MSGSPDQCAVPRDGLDLLVRAALAPEEDARAAWRSWRETHDLDATSWSEVRMLAAVAGRIAMLEEDADVRPRIEGIRKFLWVHTQMCLEQAGPGLAAVAAAGIPVLFMKGAARVVANPATAHERLIRDVDALVPLGSEERALEALQNDGWKLEESPWAIRARAAGKVAGHHAWALAKGRSEIDLHHFSNHLNRLTGDDEGLWRRSTVTAWRGAAVHLPSPADALVLAVTHGVRWSLDGAADWTVDAARLVDAGGIDWDVVLQEADSRLLHAVLHAGLAYLGGPLGRPVPRDVLDTLAHKADGPARDELAMYAARPGPVSSAEKQIAFLMATRRSLRRAGIGPPEAGSRFAALPLVSARKALGPGETAVIFAIPQASLREWLRVQIDVDAGPLPPAATLTAEARAAGLVLGGGPGEILRAADGRPVVRFQYDLPAALVALRHLDQVTVILRAAGKAFWAVTSVSVSWLRLVRLESRESRTLAESSRSQVGPDRTAR